MAKKASVKRKQQPSSLTMHLSAPGMSILHRAGLGGLACSLDYIERAYQQGILFDEELPGDWSSGTPPWEITERSITFHFGEPTAAGEYLRRLFRIAFDLKDGLIYLPGQYGGIPPNIGIRAALQDGLMLSFYDHKPKARGVESMMEYSVDVDGQHPTFRTVTLAWYKHQRDGADLAEKSLSRDQEVTRILHPGATHRHSAIARSKLTEPAERLLPLLFAPTGVLCLRSAGKRVREGGGVRFKPGAVVLIPDACNLPQYQRVIRTMLPSCATDTRIQSAEDAVLGAELRVRTASAAAALGCDFRAVFCCPSDWNQRMQPPARVFEIKAADFEEDALESYKVARAQLPPKIRCNVERNAKERGKNKTVVETERWFWSDSVVRPLVAGNLANGRLWYHGFSDLFVRVDPRNNRPMRDRLLYERKGLHAMTESIPWRESGQSVLVKAVHEALRRQYGKIAAEPNISQATKEKKWQNLYDRWRVALVGAKTSERIRFVICDMFARAGLNSVLQSQWAEVLPLLTDARWPEVRDLALLGLASYQGKGASDVGATQDDAATEMIEES